MMRDKAPFLFYFAPETIIGALDRKRLALAEFAL